MQASFQKRTWPQLSQHVPKLQLCRRKGLEKEVPLTKEAEQEDERKEDEDEWHVGPKRSAEEAEGDDRHNDVVVSLSCVVFLAQCTWHLSCSIASHNSNGWAVDISKIHPVGAVNNEDGHRERVSEDELEDACEVHGYAAQEQESAADGRN